MAKGVGTKVFGVEARRMVRMATKEVSIAFNELARMEIYCQTCDAAVLLDVTRTDGYGRIEQCPVCNKDLSEPLKTAVAAYRRFFSAATDAKAKIQFRVRAE